MIEDAYKQVVGKRVIWGSVSPLFDDPRADLVRTHPDARLPAYANISNGEDSGDSGADVYSVEDCWVGPRVTAVPVGFKIARITPGWEIQVRPRSGNARKLGVTVSNAPGTIDNGFRGEIFVLMHQINPATMFLWTPGAGDLPPGWKKVHLFSDNASYEAYQGTCPPLGALDENKGVFLPKGSKIAQFVFSRVPQGVYGWADEAQPSSRGEGGFGSTGN